MKNRIAPSVDQSNAGFAVPVATLVIVIVSMLALTGLYVAHNNLTANTAVRTGWKALYAADAGATRTVATFRDGPFADLEAGDSASTGWQSLPGGSEYRTSVLRVDDGVDDSVMLFRLRTVGRPAAGVTSQRVLVTLVEATRPNGVCCDAAIKAQGELSIRGRGSRVKVDGGDDVPSAWGGQCPATGDDLPGILLQDEDDLETNGNPEITGSPPVDEDTTINSESFSDFGEITYQDLVDIADKDFPGNQQFNTLKATTSGGVCATSDPTNWGDPLNPNGACWDYRPIVHIGGDLRLSGTGYGQGILLVDGDLTITGTVDYYGVVIVQGNAEFKGTGTIYGGMLVRNGQIGNDESTLRGNTELSYSSCVVNEVLNDAIVARGLEGRHWFEVLD